MDRRNRNLNGNIFLIGFMGCGKSTVSRAMCKKFGLAGIEMDQQIEKEEGMTIQEIFAQKGEAYFRELETNLLKRIQTKENLVVSCGGGTAMRECNVLEMKKHGKIVLLSARPATVYERVRTSHNRPLLEGNMNVEYIGSLMEKRRAKYEAAADFTVETDNKTARQIAEEIMEYIVKI